MITANFFYKVYIFPGLGLGATLAGCKVVSDKMLYKAAEALANHVTPEELAQGKIFPPLEKIRDVSHQVAVAVIQQAIEEGQATYLKDTNIDLDDFVEKKMYDPVYVPLVEKREISI
jgi:malate dehydrogenase (oxaloacetate-decarboxylating)(NADP+)